MVGNLEENRSEVDLLWCHGPHARREKGAGGVRSDTRWDSGENTAAAVDAEPGFVTPVA